MLAAMVSGGDVGNAGEVMLMLVMMAGLVFVLAVMLAVGMGTEVINLGWW